MTRRTFLDLWTSLVALAAAAAAAPAILLWWRSSSSTGGGDEVWVDLGNVGKISEDTWTARDVDVVRRNRWRTDSTREKVYVRREGSSFEVLSAICPHTGCLVRREGEGFACPCHRSGFDGAGAVVDGPSPRALDGLEWKVEKRRLKVRYQRFRPGVPDKRVVEG